MTDLNTNFLSIIFSPRDDIIQRTKTPLCSSSRYVICCWQLMFHALNEKTPQPVTRTLTIETDPLSLGKICNALFQNHLVLLALA